MDLDHVVRHRRMCRSFLDRSVDRAILERVLDIGKRAPSAGNAAGWAFLVLEGRELTREFWHHDAEASWLSNPTHPGLLRAPVIVLPLASERVYLDRYAETDKASQGRPGGLPSRRLDEDAAGLAGSGLDDDGSALPGWQPDRLGLPGPETEARWPVPYWLVDCSFGTMLLLLGVVENGLGALFFALHSDPRPLLDRLGVPEDWFPIGAVAIGWPDGSDKESGTMARRRRRKTSEVVHWNRW